jgi:hypothetical protein
MQRVLNQLYLSLPRLTKKYNLAALKGLGNAKLGSIIQLGSWGNVYHLLRLTAGLSK